MVKSRPARAPRSELSLRKVMATVGKAWPDEPAGTIGTKVPESIVPAPRVLWERVIVPEGTATGGGGFGRGSILPGDPAARDRSGVRAKSTFESLRSVWPHRGSGAARSRA